VVVWLELLEDEQVCFEEVPQDLRPLTCPRSYAMMQYIYEELYDMVFGAYCFIKDV